MDPKLLKYLMETETLPEDEAKVKLEKMTDEEIEELRKKAKMTAKPKRKTRTAKMTESDGQKSDDDKTDMGCGSKKKLEDDDEDENTSLSDDNDDDDTTNMSNDDDNNTNMSDDNEDDDSTNMSDDNEDSTDMSNGGEDDDEDEEKQKSELTARLKGFKKKSIELTRKMQTAHVGNRIMRLRAQGKISPAEIKKIDMAQLCAENKATIDAVLKTYENRQPVIHMGQYGSIQGVDNQEMEKIAKMRALEKETMANMSFTSKALGVKLAAETNEYTQDTNRVAEPVEMGDSNEENAWADIVRAVEDGRHDEGKAMFRKACRMSAGDVGASPDDLAELTAAISDLETEFGTVVQLAGKRLGIQL